MPSGSILSAVEPDAEAVEGSEPEAALSTIAILSRQRAAGHLDDGPAKRFGRERQGLAMDHVQPRPLRLAPPDEVERHLRTEARGAYPQAGEAHRICHAPAEGGPEDRRKARRRVDDPGPAMREAQVLELRERLEKVSGEKPVRGRALLERDVDAIAEVVDGVVTAPQDAIVRRTAVVMELVARVADALVLPPAKAFQPLGPEGLGDEHVVVDREDPAAQPAQRAPEAISGDHDATRVDAARGRPDPHAVTEAFQARHRRSLVDPCAELASHAQQAPAQPRRINQAVVRADAQ